MTERARGQGEDLVVVYRAPDEVTAQIVRGLLVGEDIPVVIESRQVAWMDGVFRTGEGYWGDVVVPRKFAERARELIEECQSKAEIEEEQGVQ